MKWYDRVRDVAKSKQIKQKEIAERSGVSSKVLSHYLVGRSKPSLDVLVKISESIGVSLDWMMKGVDDRFRVNTDDAASATKIPLLDAPNVYGWVTEGVAETTVMLPECLAGDKSSKTFFYRVPDKSMTEKLICGAIACVDPDAEPKANDTVLILKDPGGCPIFRSVIEEGNEYYLVAENARLPTIKWTEAVTVCGVALYAVTPFRPLGAK